MLKFLLAADGSDHVRHAITALSRLARGGVALEVQLLNVREGPVFYGELPVLSLEEIEAAQQRAQDQVLADVRSQALAEGLNVTAGHRAIGSAAAEIVRVAEEQGVDQIVIGTHGRGAMGSLFLGSVAQRVVHLAKVPVLLVK